MRDTLEMPPETALNAGRKPRVARGRAGLLIATDGRPAADAAIIVGRLLANRDGEPHELVAVEELERLDDDRRSGTIQQREMPFRLAQQRARTTNVTVDSWPLSIAYGRPGSTIADLADYEQRRLIVMGLHVHSRMDRLLGRETVLQVMHRAGCPVLAVDSNRRTIPRRALLAIDFSPSSIAAAREALRVVGETGPIYLAHVLPRITVPFDAELQAGYEPDVEKSLADLRSALSIPDHVETRIVVLRGDPATELLGFADQESIELIATGSRGFSRFRGSIIGTVPTALVRAARCSVLVVPPLSE
jgi:nucleotide-binding universal stress UspA family protein